METKNTSTGLDQNTAALLSYVLWWVSGIVFLLLEQENKYIKFHAIQSIVVFGAVSLASMVFGFFPFIGPTISAIVVLIGVALWVVLMVRAYQGVRFKLPVAGDLAEKWAESQTQPPK